MFPRPVVPALALTSLLVSLLFALGCSSSSPASDPIVSRNFDRLADQISDLQADIEDQKDALTQLVGEMQEIAVADGGVPADLTPLRATDQELTDRLTQLTEQLSAMEERIQQLQRGSVDVARSAPRPGSDTIAQSSPSSPGPTESAPRRARGVWHEYSQGDDLASIASRYDVAVDRILEANALPRNANLYPGIQLYIPQGN
jgi:LysM repeat protein